MEAVCDSSTAAAIAQEIVDIEEPGLFEDEMRSSSFAFKDVPRADELLPPAISASARLFDVQVNLPNLPYEMTTLSCKRRVDESCYEVLSREYDSQTQCWINKSIHTEQFMD